MRKLLAASLLFVGSASLLSARIVPEIDPGSAGSALALIAGAVLVIRGRKRT